MDGAEKRHWWWASAAILLAAVAVLLAMGRPPICPCGTIRLWHGSVASAENSQQLSDWYSLTHVVHGLLFYVATWALLGRQPLALRFLLAIAIEAGWEVVENTPLVIERYRAVTLALGYSGDSVINSTSDIAAMALGFAAARLLPTYGAVLLGISLEVTALLAIRDNLTLNVLMLTAPSEAVRAWQAAGQT